MTRRLSAAPTPIALRSSCATLSTLSAATPWISTASAPRCWSSSSDEGLVKSPADLYRLKAEDITALDRKAEKSANNLIAAVEKSKHNELYRLVFALGIRNIGLKAAKLLCENFLTIDDIMSAKAEDFAAIEGFGSVMAESLENYFALESTRDLIDQLKTLGLEMKPSPQKAKRRSF